MTTRSTSTAEGPTPFEHIRDLARKFVKVPKKSTDTAGSSDKNKPQNRKPKHQKQ